MIRRSRWRSVALGFAQLGTFLGTLFVLPVNQPSAAPPPSAGSKPAGQACLVGEPDQAKGAHLFPSLLPEHMGSHAYRSWIKSEAGSEVLADLVNDDVGLGTGHLSVRRHA